MKEISINQNSSTEKVKFGPVGRDIILNEKIEDETARAIAKETQLEEAIATAGAVKDVKCDGTSIVVSKVADIGPSIDAKVLVETTRAEAAEAALETGKSNATNIENGTGSGSVQMKSDGGITTFDFTGKNPNATAFDPTLTGNIPYGATGQYATSFGGKNAAQGKRASSQGSTTIAKGDYSDASGINSVSLGIGATAQGLSTTAYGQGAHSEGNNTLAIGPFSHTEGRNTITYNEEAHAGGLDSIAARPYSFAHGNYVVAENIAEAVFGQYNNFTGSGSYDNNRLFVVGNGQDHTHRSNAFEVYKDGSAKVGKANGSETNLTVATKGYVDAQDANLQEQVNNLKARGRYLSLWNSTTGLPADNPTQLPYTYKAGDYYIIGTVGTGVILYKPEGTSYTGTASPSEETREVSINDVYYFDGTNWAFQSNAQKEVSFSGLAGTPTDNTALATALSNKVDLSSAQTITGTKTFNGTTYLGGTVYVPTNNFTTRDIKPSDTNVYSLGTPDNRFANLYLSSYLNVSGFVDSELKPRYNDEYNLGRDDGSNVNRWKNIYVSQKLDFKAKTDTPATTASWQLDSRSNGNFVVSCNNGDAYIFRQNDFIPYGSNVNRNLGVAGNYWNDLYLKGKIDLYNSTSAQTWGLTGSQYDGIFITRSSANIYTFNAAGIFPSSNGARSLGTSDYNWKNIYFKGELNANGSAGTAGQVLTSNGDNAAPTWQDPSGGGLPEVTATYTNPLRIWNLEVGSYKLMPANEAHYVYDAGSSSTRSISVGAGEEILTVTRIAYSSGNKDTLYWKVEANTNNCGFTNTSGYMTSGNGYSEDTWTGSPIRKCNGNTAVSSSIAGIWAPYGSGGGSSQNLAGAVLYSQGGTYAPRWTDQGTAGQVLTSNGADAPTWTDAPTPSNMVTIDSAQLITGIKTMRNNFRIGSQTYYTDFTYDSSSYRFDIEQKYSSSSIYKPTIQLKNTFVVYPSVTNTCNLGRPNLRWNTIYTTDINASGNITDGTNSTTVANIAVKSTESTETTGQLKIAVVTALPENPDANTLYFIKEA